MRNTCETVCPYSIVANFQTHNRNKALVAK
ncbi:hypothetical protein SAMN05216593_10762 [Pseudomonas asturiensis]|uniref:Uncharacterized protein n=1 Tax=Pseudomonas asturiensis TaxID=1190415 RepID=A0A1M7NV82_9PSED|nr:hypothetical protein SAMN05216593_10762 [Pseudomonas asturiensis]